MVIDIVIIIIIDIINTNINIVTYILIIIITVTFYMKTQHGVTSPCKTKLRPETPGFFR